MSKTPSYRENFDYAIYLLSPEWRAIRDRALDRDGRRCRLCNAGHNLHVHHRTYARIGRERLDDLTTLCGDCHGKYHNIVAGVKVLAPTKRPTRKKPRSSAPGEFSALGVACPYCKAGVGVKCVKGKGSHPVRKKHAAKVAQLRYTDPLADIRRRHGH